MVAKAAIKQGVATIKQPITSSPENGSCRDAIAKFWPKELQNTAITILTHENRRESPTALNHNTDGTIDTGCLQINSIHKAWVDISKLNDPDYNAQVGYRLYQVAGIRSWMAVKGILWN